MPHLPRGLPTVLPQGQSAREDAQTLQLAVTADRIHDAVDSLAWALQRQRATYTPWRRRAPDFKPVVAGSIRTPSGPRRVAVMLDTGATHCFICAGLSAALALPPGAAPGPSAVSMASPDTRRPLSPPVSVRLALCSTQPLREVIDMSPLELDTTLDIILGWDWISSHDLQFLYPEGTVTGSGATGTLAAPLLNVASPDPDQTRVLVSHGEMCRMLRRVIPGTASTPSRVSSATHPTGTAPPLAPQGLYQATPRLETSGVAEIAQLDAAYAADAPRATPFATGSERLADGTELHLASLCFVDTRSPLLSRVPIILLLRR